MTIIVPGELSNSGLGGDNVGNSPAKSRRYNISLFSDWVFLSHAHHLGHPVTSSEKSLRNGTLPEPAELVWIYMYDIDYMKPVYLVFFVVVVLFVQNYFNDP